MRRVCDELRMKEEAASQSNTHSLIERWINPIRSFVGSFVHRDIQGIKEVYCSRFAL